MNALILYSFTAGAVATVNPCGFALLPTWFAREMAVHADRSAAGRFVRSVLSGGAVSFGFITVFSIFSLIIASGAVWLGPALPWIGVTLGFGLALVGASWAIDIGLPRLSFVAACRRANSRFGAFGFGLSYGLASVSCILPIFMSVAGLSFFIDGAPSSIGILSFLAGAVSVLVLVSIGGTYSGAGLARLIQGKTILLRRLSGVLTFLAGVYITLYWGRLFFDSTPRADEIANIVGAYSIIASAFVSSKFGIAFLLFGTMTMTVITWFIFNLGKGHRTTNNIAKKNNRPISSDVNAD